MGFKRYRKKVTKGIKRYGGAIVGAALGGPLGLAGAVIGGIAGHKLNTLRRDIREAQNNAAREAKAQAQWEHDMAMQQAEEQRLYMEEMLRMQQEFSDAQLAALDYEEEPPDLLEPVKRADLYSTANRDQSEEDRLRRLGLMSTFTRYGGNTLGGRPQKVGIA